MSEKQRDHSLDLIKGLACLLMIFAHTPYTGKFSNEAFFIGGLAPIFFASVAGITTYFQRNKDLKEQLFYYVMFFLLAFSLNGSVGQNIYSKPQVTILHMIALGSILTLAVLNTFGMSKINLIIFSLASYAIHLFNLKTHFLNVLTRFVVVMPPANDFSIFPWIIFFFFGILVYITKNLKTRLLYWVAITLLFVAEYFTINQPFNKWEMSVSYLLLSFGLFAVSFDLFKHFRSTILEYFGEHSLLFYYASWFCIFFFNIVGKSFMNNPLIWIIIAFSTWLGMKILQLINQRISWIAQNKWTWIVQLVIIFLLPLFGLNRICSLVYYAIGFFFSLNYKNLRQTLFLPNLSSKRSAATEQSV